MPENGKQSKHAHTSGMV